jgi:molybdenum cofactor cytidylyltransferase
MTAPQTKFEMSEAVAIILAAGVSRRMGRSKAALSFRGSTFLEHLVNTYRKLGVQRVIVVVNDDTKLPEASPPDAEFLVNPNFKEGPVTSIKIALSTLPPYWPGYFIHPVDHPVVTSATLKALYQEWGVNPYRAVKPIFDGHGGHPVLLGRGWSHLIQSLPTTSNLRELLHSHPGNVTGVSVTDPGVLLNVNDAVQYKQLLKLYPE